MPTTRKKRANSSKDKNVYEKVEDLPEGRKKIYESILEDFDKQGSFCKNSTVFRHFPKISTFFHFSVEARIEQIFSSVNALQKQIRSQFKVALLQQPRNARDLKVEDHYYANESAADLVASTSMNLTAELAKVAASVTFKGCQNDRKGRCWCQEKGLQGHQK
jgi:hypothetical protein